MEISKLQQDITNYIETNPKQAIKNVAIAYVGFKVVQHIKKKIIKRNKQRQYKRIVDQYLKERQKVLDDLKTRVDNYDLNLSEELIEQILNSSLGQLRQLLKDGVITSVQLLHLYTKRAITIGVEHNAVTDTNFDEALKQAEYCDNLRKTNPEKCEGELFGIVVSLKDNQKMKGMRVTLGAASNLNNFQDEDGPMVTILRQAGAILYIKTNVPQFMMTYETVNYIYGHCLNPWSKERTAGGSSGGESSLVASRCSPIGVGSDIGGSVRMPCHFTGLTGFKQGFHRISFTSVGKHMGYYCPTVIKSNAGPLAKYVEDNADFLRTIYNKKYQENIPVTQRVNCPLTGFDEKEYTSKRKLRIGYIKNYEPFTCTLAQQRAVDIAVEALKEQGHELIEMSLPQEYVIDIRNAYCKVAFGDGLDEFIEAAKGEKILPFYEFFITMFTQITPIKPLKWLLQTILRLKGDKDTANVLEASQRLSVLGYKVAQGEVKQLEKKILKLLFDDQNIDIMIQPTTNVPALKLNCSIKDRISSPAMYTYIWNLIPLPIGSQPVGLVNKDEQHYDNATLQGMQTQKIKRHMIGSEGLPISVSVFGPPLSEELCLNVMKQIEDKVNFYEKHFKKI